MQAQIHLPPRSFTGKTTGMTVPKTELLQAIELAIAGKWDAAHQIVQQHETTLSPRGFMSCCTRLKATSATPATGIAAPAGWIMSKMNRAPNWRSFGLY